MINIKPVMADNIPLEQAIFTKAWNMLKTYRNIKENEDIEE